MSQGDQRSEKERSQYAFNVTLAAVAGQVGCITLVIILGALFGGLWLDSRFDTKPAFTLGLMVASVPVTLVMMFWVVRATTSRINSITKQKTQEPQEGLDRGKTS